MRSLIRPLTKLDEACFSCQVPDGCDENNPLCERRFMILLGKSPAPLERRNELRQKRRDVLKRLLEVGEEKSSYFTELWGWPYDEVSKRIMLPLRDVGYIERADGRNGAYAKWRLAQKP